MPVSIDRNSGKPHIQRGANGTAATVRPSTSVGVDALAARDAAQTSASAASTSASSAATSASNAATSATAAQNAKTGAETARAGAEAVGNTNDTIISGRINDTTSATRAALNSSIDGRALPRWQPTTAYTAGDKVLAPDGSIVERITSGTSGPTYSGTNWKPATGLTNTFARKWIVDVKGDHGAVGDGATDDSAAFTAAIATAARHILVPPGTYLVTALTLNQANQTLLLSPGATLKTKSGTQTLATITAANVGIVATGPNAVIDGNSIGTSAGSTIYVSGAADARVQGLIFQNCAGIGVNAQGTRPVIRDNTLINCGSTSIYVKPPTTGADLESASIDRNVIRNSANVSGIQVQANGAAKIVRAKILGNEVAIPSTTGSPIGIELYGGSSGCVVASNTIDGGSIGISVDSGASNAVQGNYVSNVGTTGIELAGCGRCTATGNTVVLSATGTVGGIQVVNNGTGYNTVVGNTVTNSGTSGRGVYCQGTSGATTTIMGNTLTAKKPVLIDAGAGCEVVGNKLVGVNSAVVGVELNNCTYVRVSDNTVVNCSSAAVNAYTGTMAGIVVGPNIMMGGTPAVEVINGWVPGTSGTGSRIIRGNQTPGGIGSITVGASPFTYTNVDLTPQAVYISGGTVSDITKNAVSVFAASPATVWLDPGEAITVTYSVAPTMKRDRK